ncbi:hypothetical protein J2R99_000737 [Rhodopseudomonas julia]|uniref:Uncharacterized protein n=1 Tax=Rhodopseudomonas julia TaxID=200617 RepID=A0ABU0C2Z5_9BRAD|nr:hypothetical protein [Rhodopseudomonas julia]
MTSSIEAWPPRRQLPTPEDVLFAWLIWLPTGANLQLAAREELQRSQFRQPATPEVERLGMLLEAVSNGTPPLRTADVRRENR